jgi:hypothetical protein
VAHHRGREGRRARCERGFGASCSADVLPKLKYNVATRGKRLMSVVGEKIRRIAL